MEARCVIGYILDVGLLIFLIVVGEEFCLQHEDCLNLQQWEIGFLKGSKDLFWVLSLDVKLCGRSMDVKLRGRSLLVLD